MNSKEQKIDLRKVVTVPFRMSFPFLVEPRKDNESGRLTFSLTMLFPPKTDLGVFKTALRAAMAEKFGPDEKKWPNVRHTPREVIRDFEAYNAAAKRPLDGDWKGWTIIRANANPGENNKFAPNIVGPTKGQDGKFPRISDPREIYGGRWASAVIEAYHFSGPKNNGVTFGLRSVQLLKHDNPFGVAFSKPEDDFEDAPEEWSGETDDFERGQAENAVPMRSGSVPAGGANDASPW
jgi:hypothetical protein